MQRSKLSCLFKDISSGYIGNKNLFNKNFVYSISTDTRSLKKNDLFFAIPGSHNDGHDFIPKALEKGALGIVFEINNIEKVKHFFIKRRDILFLGVENTKLALGTVAKNYLSFFPVKKLVITGSCGKTSTKNFIKSVLSQKFNVVSSIESYNNDIGVPKTIFNIDKETDFLIQEIGTNHPGEIKYLSDIVLQNFSLITNIGPSHIEFFGNENNIAREKKYALMALNKEGIAFLNAEDKYFDFFKEGIAAQVKSFGMKKGDLFPDKILKVDINKTEFILFGEKITIDALGLHNVVNAISSALVGKALDLSLKEIKRGIESYKGEIGRGKAYNVNGFTIIDESYNANPLSVLTILNYLYKVAVKGRRILVFGDMLELGERSYEYHRNIAVDIIKNNVDFLYTFGEMAKVTGDFCKEKGYQNVFHFYDIHELISCLKEGVKKNDLVLIKASRGMRLERVVKELLTR